MKTPEMLKSFSRKRLGKNIRQLLLYMYVKDVHLFVFVLLPDEVVLGFNVLRAFVVLGVLY